MRKRIMIVDDSSTLRRMIEQALTNVGFEVLSCSSGREAIEQIKTADVDVVITDLNMPDLDGLSLTRQLRAEPRTACCPILILTTEDAPARKQEAKRAGASGWVMKPFEPSTLVQAINTVCKRLEAVR